jgi:hypothetical protein
MPASNQVRYHEGSIELESFDELPVVSIRPSHEQMTDWCISLCLLDKGYINRIVLRRSVRPFKVQITRDASISASRRGIPQLDPERLTLSLSSSELATWVAFFLKYCRDGRGEVDHHDLDMKDAGGMDFAVILYVPR